jgi:hypothetical protein
MQGFVFSFVQLSKEELVGHAGWAEMPFGTKTNNLAKRRIENEASTNK